MADKTSPGSVKLHTLYRTGKYLASVAVIKRHRKTRGGRFPIPRRIQLTEIHDGVAESAHWFDTEPEALHFARQLGYTRETEGK